MLPFLLCGVKRSEIIGKFEGEGRDCCRKGKEASGHYFFVNPHLRGERSEEKYAREKGRRKDEIFANLSWRRKGRKSSVFAAIDQAQKERGGHRKKNGSPFSFFGM